MQLIKRGRWICLEISFLEKIFTNRQVEVLSDYAFFSVLVPLVYYNNTSHLLFEIRSDKLKRQPNEICFPGGKIEMGESPKACALRETSEELNISLDRIKIISELDYIITYSNFTLYSFLGEIDYSDVAGMNFNKNEVKDYFLVPFDFFMEANPIHHEIEILPKTPAEFPHHLIQNGKDYNWRKGKIPVYLYTYGDKVIWGLTARIIANMVKIIKEH